MSARSRTRHVLAALLARKEYPPAEVAAALLKLGALGYLDDARYARDRAVGLLREARLGPEGVTRRLLAQGLSEEQAKKAVAEATAELSFEPLAAARALLSKRGLGGELGPRELGRAARLLRSRGFGEELIEQLLGDPALVTSERAD